MATQRQRFTAGLSAGVLTVALAALILALAADQTASGSLGERIAGLASWIWRNLGMSTPVFALILTLYALSLERLRRALAEGAPMQEVGQADHLSDVWTSVFFGVGVIWTAIGMRGALVQALAGNAGPGGGVEVLERMVDGGILLALSTTIFGGVGGYLMRVWKTLTVGSELKRYYGREQRRDLTAIRISLSAIERRVAGPPPGPEPKP
ncbi:MAG: hypothetical protein PVG91_05270 [Gammaproteobacteria bacterium]|jgi:hypothetical protein